MEWLEVLLDFLFVVLDDELFVIGSRWTVGDDLADSGLVVVDGLFQLSYLLLGLSTNY